jgi:hypothetical protein
MVADQSGVMMRSCDLCGQRLEPDPLDWKFAIPQSVAQLRTHHGETLVVRGIVCVASGWRWLDACGPCLVGLVQRAGGGKVQELTPGEGPEDRTLRRPDAEGIDDV